MHAFLGSAGWGVHRDRFVTSERPRCYLIDQDRPFRSGVARTPKLSDTPAVKDGKFGIYTHWGVYSAPRSARMGDGIETQFIPNLILPNVSTKRHL